MTSKSDNRVKLLSAPMTSKSDNRCRRGSALIVAMFFAIAISAIVGTYLKLATVESKMADSSFLYNSLLNLTEKGAEDAAWALNNCDEDVDWTADGWIKMTIGDIDYMTQLITGVDLGNGKTGTVYIVVEDYTEVNPILYVEAQALLSSGRIISKQLKIDLSMQALLATGLIAKDKLTISGTVSLDSYNSTVGIWNAATNRNADITTGSLSAAPNMVNVSGTVNVYGVLGTGGPAPNINSPSTVRGPETQVGVDIDTNRISTSLSGQFEDPAAPDTSGFTVNLSGGNSMSGGLVQLGDPSGNVVEEYFLTTDLSLSGQSTLRIKGPVIIVMDTNKSVDVSGSSQIEVTDTGSLTFYTDGDFSISGEGLVNASAIPENLIIYGTDPVPNGQNITLSGNADLQAVVYTPNASLTISGGNSTSGAVVANEITMSGTTTFHYDEALANFFGGSDTYEMNKWLELSDIADRIDITGTYFY